MGDLFRHKGHLLRVAALFAAGLGAFFVLRAVLVPEGFGVYGHYRAGAIEANRARPISFAGRAVCLECHSDVPEAMKGGKHEGVHCEACHGALAAHAGDPTEKKAVRPDSRVLCARCHSALVARPAGFPQVEVEDHMGEEACTACHLAHEPAQMKEETK